MAVLLAVLDSTTNRYGREISSVGGNMLRGGVAGLAGGLVQDGVMSLLESLQDCDCGN